MNKQLFKKIYNIHAILQKQKIKTRGKIECGKKYAVNITSPKPSINLKPGCTRLRTKYLF